MNLSRRLVTLALLTLTFVINSEANPINGTMSYSIYVSQSGEPDDWSTALGFFNFDVPYFITTGDYPMLEAPSMHAQSYLPVSPALPILDYWSVYTPGGAVRASFDITSFSIIFPTATTYIAQGSGIAYLTGFEATYGTWKISGGAPSSSPTGGSRAVFSANGIAAIPDTGTTIAMFGSALLALAIVHRRFEG